MQRYACVFVLGYDCIYCYSIILCLFYSILLFKQNKTTQDSILCLFYSILLFKQNHARWNEGTGINADLLSNKVKITFTMIFD